MYYLFFFSSRRRHTRLQGDWSSDVCSSDLRGRSLWMIIGFPEPHVREALLRALRAHLVLEDRKDDDVPALAPVRLRLAQHAFLLEPVATERVDAQDIVGVNLGLDAPDLEGVHRPR